MRVAVEVIDREIETPETIHGSAGALGEGARRKTGTSVRPENNATYRKGGRVHVDVDGAAVAHQIDVAGDLVRGEGDGCGVAARQSDTRFRIRARKACNPGVGSANVKAERGGACYPCPTC